LSGNSVMVMETGEGLFAELVTVGRHVMRADEPVQAGGQDAGPSPYEFLMAGLGACTAMTMRGYAQRHQWTVGTISVTTRHEKVASAGAGRIDRFDREISIAGELSDEQRSRLLEVAEACPVSMTLRHPSLVTLKIAAR
jgi:putative redox protein